MDKKQFSKKLIENTLSQREISDYLNAYGTESLSPLVINSKDLAEKIIGSIPFSFSFLNEAFKNEHIEPLIYAKIENEDLENLQITDINLGELLLNKQIYKFEITRELLKSILTKDLVSKEMENLWMEKVLSTLEEQSDMVEELSELPKSEILKKIISQYSHTHSILLKLLSEEEFVSNLELIKNEKTLWNILINSGIKKYLLFLENTQLPLENLAILTYSLIEKHGTSKIVSENQWKVVCKSLSGDVEISKAYPDVIAKMNHFNYQIPKFSEMHVDSLISVILESQESEEDLLKLITRSFMEHEADGSNQFFDKFFSLFLPRESINKEYKELVVKQYKELIESRELFNKYLGQFTHIIDFSKYKKNLTLMIPSLVKTIEHMDLFADKMSLLSNSEMSDELFTHFLKTQHSIQSYVFIKNHSKERQDQVLEKFTGDDNLYTALDLFSKLDNQTLIDIFLYAIKNQKSFYINSEQLEVIIEGVEFKKLSQEDWTFFATEIKKTGPRLKISNKDLAEKILNACPENLKWIFAYKTAKIMADQDPSLVKKEYVLSTNAKELFFSENFYKFSTEVLYRIYRERSAWIYTLDEDLDNSYKKFVFLMENFSTDPTEIMHVPNHILINLRDRGLKIQGQSFSYLNGISHDLLEYALEYVDEKDKAELLKDYSKNISLETVIKLSKYYRKILNSLDREFLGNDLVIKSLYKIMPEEVIEYLSSIANHDSFNILGSLQLSPDHLKQGIIQINSIFSSMTNNTLFINKITQSLISKNLSVEELVGLIDNQKLSHEIENNLSVNYQYEYIQELRKQKKDSLIFNSTKYDLISDQSWDYYNLHFENNEMNDKDQDVFFKKVDNSLKGPVSFFNTELIKRFKFSRNKDLLKVLKSIDSEKFNSLILSLISSPNKEMLIDVINENINLLKKLETNTSGDVISNLIFLYNNGVKSLFQFDYKGLKLDWPSVVDLLNDTEDPFLLEKYKKSWKKLRGHGIDYNKKIVKELVKNIDSSDITLENLSFYDKKLYFEIGGVEVYRATLMKKRWVAGTNLRPDLEGVILQKYNNICAKRPEKILGAIMIDNPEEFIPQDASFDDISFNVNESVLEKIIYFKELGGEGFVPAIATRSSDFSYYIDIALQEHSSIDLNEIEKQIAKKTYDINSQIEKLLKMDSKRTFGFELELGVFHEDRKDVADFLRKRGFDINVSYSSLSSRGDQWDFKEDSSLDKSAVNYGDEDDDSGDVFEIASPILCGEDGIEEAKKFLNGVFLFEVVSGEEVSGGLHVHHYIQDLEDLVDSSEELLKTYLPFQETLYSLVKDSRSEGEFCKKIQPNDIRHGRNVYGGHSGVILTSYGTMEFRMKEGLVNADKIINWIKFTQQVVLAMEFKIKDNLSKQKDQNDLLAKASMLMLMDFMRSGQNIKEKLKKAKKMVSFQEALYENKL